MENEELYRVAIPVLVPFLVGVLKRQVSKLPKRALPWVAMLAGLVLEVLRAYLSSGPVDPVVGSALGLAGVGLREVVDQTAKSRKP